MVCVYFLYHVFKNPAQLAGRGDGQLLKNFSKRKIALAAAPSGRKKFSKKTGEEKIRGKKRWEN